MKLLFLCTHNACRSIVAEAVARQLGGMRLQVQSAGSHSSGRVHPLTLRYLKEAGYSVDGLDSQSVDDVATFSPDVVITVCDAAAQEPCPLWLGQAERVHWGLSDPSRLQGSDADKAGAFASLIRTIEHRIKALLTKPFDNIDSGELAELLNNIAMEQ
ncbi:MAG: arsenate reductase ArsC [Halioglobus sp.]